MTLAKATARADKTFTVQASLTNVTYNHPNILFIVQATGHKQKTAMGFYSHFIFYLTYEWAQ